MIPETSVTKISLKIIYLKFHLNLPGANELNIYGTDALWELCNKSITRFMKDINGYTMFNPLRAKFFRGNINIYLHFVSFLHIDTTQVVEIPPQIRLERTYST